MAQDARSDFTNGTVTENIIRMTLPLTIALLVNVLYSVVDRIYIGHIPEIGAAALSGIGIASPIISGINAFERLCAGALRSAPSQGEGGTSGLPRPTWATPTPLCWRWAPC